MKDIMKIENGNLIYDGFNLKELALKYGTPLKITFLDVIKKRIEELKLAFDKAILDSKYNGKFIYLNANKANYSKEEIETALKFSDGLETSSYYDLLVTERIMKNNKEYNKYIVSNGYKERNYIDNIVRLHKEGFNIIDIIDSLDEYEYLKSLNIDLKVGLRIHLEAQYAEDEVKNDRFGLNEEELKFINDDLKKTNLKLTTIHFHQRGFDFEHDKFYVNINKLVNAFSLFYNNYSNTLENIDLGGGTPLPINDDYDYYNWALELINYLKKKLNKDVNIIIENGKYSQKDATVNVYKVIAKKETDTIPWYVVNSSLLIALPEMYALGEEILVMPINGLDKLTKKGRLAGVTCDCDDVLYDKKTFDFDLPDEQDIYIGLIGTGSYQNSMNGKGGLHHCLLPEELDLVIDLDGNKIIRKDLQSIEDVFKMMKI